MLERRAEWEAEAVYVEVCRLKGTGDAGCCMLASAAASPEHAQVRIGVEGHITMGPVSQTQGVVR